MLSERDIELAHPEAFDFVFGNLPRDKRAEFNRHLSTCRYCQTITDEYGEVGRIIKNLPPHVGPPPDLEERTVAAMVAALASPMPESQPPVEEETRIQPRPHLQPPAEEGTRIQPRPHLQPPAEPQPRPIVTQLSGWRRHRGRLATAVAVAAAIIAAAVVIPLSLGSGRTAPAVILLHATAAAKVFGVGTATATATARQAGESWTFDLTVQGLKPLPGDEFYECWWAAPGPQGHLVLATGGSFIVGKSGTATITMTTGVDPTQTFRTMEITPESPGDGAQHGPVLLIGKTL